MNYDSPSTPQRDLRIDFLRGLALLRIFSAHVQGGSPIRIGFSDFAECFVFLSGYVCGLVYYRRLVNEGFLRCQARISYRAGQLYFAHVITTLVMFGILAAVHRYEPYSFYVGSLSGFERFLIAPIDAVQDVFLLKYQCAFLTILPLFVVLTLLLPTMLLIFRSGPLLMLGLSVGLYVAYQISPGWVGHWDPWQSSWYFKPFAWQLMFFLGAYLGAKGTSSPPFWTRHAVFVVVALGALEAAFLFKILVPSYYSMLIDKGSLGILRVVYFALLVLLVATFVPRKSPFWQSWIARPVVLCGQQSLIVYCSGALLSTIASLVLSLCGDDWMVHGVVLAVGWIACFGTAYGWKVLRCSTWSAPSERGLLSTSTVVLPGSCEVPERTRFEAGRPIWNQKAVNDPG